MMTFYGELFTGYLHWNGWPRRWLPKEQADALRCDEKLGVPKELNLIRGSAEFKYLKSSVNTIH